MCWRDGAARGNLFPQFDDLSLHLRIAATLSDPLEVRLNLAIQFESTTPRTIRPRVLNNIASKLLLATFIAGALDGLSPLIVARVIIHILYTSRRAVHARDGHIAFATLYVRSRHGDRCMINPRHYGLCGDWRIIVLRGRC
jgi:hypothetical protein